MAVIIVPAASTGTVSDKFGNGGDAAAAAERGWFLLQHSLNFNSYSYTIHLLLLPIGGVNIFHNFAPDPTADSYPLDNGVL